MPIHPGTARCLGFAMLVALAGLKPVTAADCELAEGDRMVELSWTYDGRTYTNRDGNFMTLYRRGDDGDWQIIRRIWNDPLPEQELQ